MIITNKFPVVVIANYRTGSSALARNLSNKLNIPGYVEPHWAPHDWSAFTNCLANENNLFVLKFIAEQADEFAEYKAMFSKDCFKIRLYREDKIEQIVSYYIASVTETWFRQRGDEENKYFLPFDESKAINAINRILHNDAILDHLSVQFDVTTSYEKLGFIENTTLVKTIPPTNIRSIRSFIQRMYNESR
jgi:hypothetical protein